MKHVSLYRKWRPKSLGQIVGQEPITRTLRRAIETDRVAHAYMFSGPRGTGKTSTAKVLAMGLNCVQGPTPEPCGVCESCRAITNNSSLDVVEMDAASNRGIDEIRDLRDRVNLAPSAGRMKIYIIDEVHMLTTEAFNALLKMLEEPPEHVVFILATTEPHRVLPTIVSRCQRFDFRRPSVETLAEKLREISETEGILAEPEALTVIAREGKGSFRDAEGLLDQLSSFAEADAGITAPMVRDLLGSVGSEVLIETTDALHERRAGDALLLIDRLSNEGKDLGQFVGELLAHLRRLMLLPDVPEVALSDVGTEERGPLGEQSKRVPTAEVVRLVEALGDASGRLKRGGDPKLELELTFLKLARDYTEPSVDVLLRRLETLEAAVVNGKVTGNSSEAAAPARPEPTAAPENPPGMPEPEDSGFDDTSEVGEEPVDPEPPVSEELAPEEPTTEEPASEEAAGGQTGSVDVASAWEEIVEELKQRRQALTAAVYAEARVESFDGETLSLVFPEEQGFYVGMANDRKHIEELQKVLEGWLGSRPGLEVRVDGARAAPVAEVSEPPEIPDENPPESFGDAEDTRNGPEARGREGEKESPATAAGDPNGGLPVAGGRTDDGIIRDPREVVEMARERFNLSGGKQNGGA